MPGKPSTSRRRDKLRENPDLGLIDPDGDAEPVSLLDDRLPGSRTRLPTGGRTAPTPTDTSAGLPAEDPSVTIDPELVVVVDVPPAPACVAPPAGPAATPDPPTAPDQGGGLDDAGLLAAGLLTRYRRRSSNSTAAAALPADAVDVLVRLRLAADTHTAKRIDEGLRALGRWATAAGVPGWPWDVVTVLAGPTELAIVWADIHPDAPPPWEMIDAGRSWVLPAAADVQVPGTREPHEVVAPWPLLCPIGRVGDVHVLLDIAGETAIVGDPDIAHQVAVAAAVTMATAPWSHGVHVELVGDGLADLTVLAPRRLHHPDTGALLGAPSTAGTVLIACGPLTVSDLARVTRDTDTAAGVGARRPVDGLIAVGDLPASRRITVTDSRQITVSSLGYPIVPHTLPAAHRTPLASLFTSLQDAPSGGHPTPWDHIR